MDLHQVDKIRNRVHHSLSPHTAQIAGPPDDASGTWLTLQNLQQFLCFKFLPTDAQLTRLAQHLGVKL